MPQVFNESAEGEQKKVNFETSVFKGQLVKPSDEQRRWPAVQESIQTLLLLKHGSHPDVTPSTISRSTTQ
jgi:hypothetical protein